jgi:hypothetical protein
MLSGTRDRSVGIALNWPCPAIVVLTLTEYSATVANNRRKERARKMSACPSINLRAVGTDDDAKF